jgi:hypothetical protein
MYRIYTRIIDNVIKILWLTLIVKWLIADSDVLKALIN